MCVNICKLVHVSITVYDSFACCMQRLILKLLILNYQPLLLLLWVSLLTRTHAHTHARTHAHMHTHVHTHTMDAACLFSTYLSKKLVCNKFDWTKYILASQMLKLAVILSLWFLYLWFISRFGCVLHLHFALYFGLHPFSFIHIVSRWNEGQVRANRNEKAYSVLSIAQSWTPKMSIL